ncbi:MAG: hypothetical protein HQ568_07870 [Calditrichaeota bacterium]|nr:hypothetical protein [Calditrichota bacterium]
MAEDITPPENMLLVIFRLIGLLIGLGLIGWGIWVFVSRLVLHPDEGGSVILPLVIIAFGVFIALATRISKKKADALENLPG